MARPDVKPNPSGSPITGATQQGTLAVATGAVDYSSGGWYGGVDDSSGYVIGIDAGTIDIVGNLDTTGNPVGVDTPTFWRSASKSDADLLKLINKLPGNGTKFNNLSAAQSWLDGSPYSIITTGGTPPPPGPPPSSAGVVVYVTEAGSNIIMTASGSLNIDALTLVSANVGPAMGGGIGPGTATFISGATGQNFDEYSGFSSVPSNFGTGGGIGASSASGDVFGVIYNGAPPHHLIVPTDYLSGDSISSTQTINSQSFSSLGLVEGTYTYTWGSGASADSIDVVVGTGGGAPPPPGPTPPSPPSPPSGSGSWYFYSDEGSINAGPPNGNGNAIFTIQGSPILETFNPNKGSGTSFLYFDVKDSTGTDYTNQFNSLLPGGTITVSQNGDTATYTSNAYGVFVVVGSGGGNQFLAINTSAATQTKSSNATFTYSDPISIAVGS